MQINICQINVELATLGFNQNTVMKTFTFFIRDSFVINQ